MKIFSKGKGNVAPTAPTAPAVQAAHQRYIQPAPAPQQHFQPAPAPGPAPVHHAPASAQNNYHPQANPFQVDINTSSYAYTAPTYSAQARGVSFTYNAQY